MPVENRTESMDTSDDSGPEDHTVEFEAPKSPTAEDIARLRQSLMVLGTTATAKVPPVSLSATEKVESGTLPPVTASPSRSSPSTPRKETPIRKAKSLLKKSLVVSPDILEQFQVFLSLQGAALGKAKSKAARQQQQAPPPAAALGAPSSSRCVPVLPPALVAPSPPLPKMPQQAPAPGSVVLGAAMAASSDVTDLTRLISNQAAMAQHQHNQARQTRLKAAEAKVEFCSYSSVTPVKHALSIFNIFQEI